MNNPQRMAVLGVAMFVVSSGTMPIADLRAGEQGGAVNGNPAPTATQIQAVFAHLVENQHRNDLALDEFERVERVITAKGRRQLTSSLRPYQIALFRPARASRGSIWRITALPRSP